MAILEHGPSGYTCVVLLAPNLCFVNLPAQELTLPESFHTTHTHHNKPAHRAAPCGSDEVVSTDRRCANHAPLSLLSLHPDPSPTGKASHESSKDGARECTVLWLTCCTQTTGPVHLRPAQPSVHGPTTSLNYPYPTIKDPFLCQGRWEDSQPRP